MKKVTKETITHKRNNLQYLIDKESAILSAWQIELDALQERVDSKKEVIDRLILEKKDLKEDLDATGI